MNYNNDEMELVIDNEYDYSNIVPVVDIITYIVQFCDNTYQQFMKIVDEEMVKNEKLKYEFKEYRYKKHFSQKFEVNVRGKNFEHITYKNYSSYIEALNNNRITNLSSLEIRLDLNFYRGKEENLKSHENEFRILFEPYSIIFKRNSNYKDSEMDQVEKNINDIMKKFPAYNTIFYSKK